MAKWEFSNPGFLKMRLRTKVAGALMLITLGSLGLVNYVNYEKYRSTFLDVFNSHFAVTSDYLKRTIENGITLGFSLDQLSNVRGALQRAKDNDPEILAIETTDMSGVPIWSVGERSADNLSIDWITRAGKSADPHRFTEGEREYAVGTLLEDYLGGTAGTLIIHYSKTHATEHLGGVLRRLIGIMIGAFAVGAALIVLTMRCLLGGFTRGVRSMTEYLENPASAAPTLDSDSILADLEQRLEEYRRDAETLLDRSEPVPPNRA